MIQPTVTTTDSQPEVTNKGSTPSTPSPPSTPSASDTLLLVPPPLKLSEAVDSDKLAFRISVEGNGDATGAQGASNDAQAPSTVAAATEQSMLLPGAPETPRGQLSSLSDALKKISIGADAIRKALTDGTLNAQELATLKEKHQGTLDELKIVNAELARVHAEKQKLSQDTQEATTDLNSKVSLEQQKINKAVEINSNIDYLIENAGVFTKAINEFLYQIGFNYTLEVPSSVTKVAMHTATTVATSYLTDSYIALSRTAAYILNEYDILTNQVENPYGKCALKLAPSAVTLGFTQAPIIPFTLALTGISYVRCLDQENNEYIPLAMKTPLARYILDLTESVLGFASAKNMLIKIGEVLKLANKFGLLDHTYDLSSNIQVAWEKLVQLATNNQTYSPVDKIDNKVKDDSSDAQPAAPTEPLPVAGENNIDANQPV